VVEEFVGDNVSASDHLRRAGTPHQARVSGAAARSQLTAAAAGHTMMGAEAHPPDSPERASRGAKLMATDHKIEALQSVGLFAGCSKKELASVARLCTTLDVDKGFVLTTQGTRGNECFVIGAGNAEVAIDDKAVATVGPGDCVGEMSLLDGGPRTATVTALGPMTLYLLSSGEFRSLLQTNAVARKIMISLAQRLRGAETDRPH
jgi:hypothetical protein